MKAKSILFDFYQQRWLASAALVLFSVCVSIAQKAQIEFFPKGDHLSSLMIRFTHQDDDGFIWVFGHKADRYDGYNFVPADGQDNHLPHFYNENYFGLSSKGIVYQSGEHLYIQSLNDWSIDSISFAEVLPKHANFVNRYMHELSNGQLLFIYEDSLTKEFNMLQLEDNQLVKRWAKSTSEGGATFEFSPVLSDRDNNLYVMNKGLNLLLQYDREGKLAATYLNPENNGDNKVVRIFGGDNIFFSVHQKLYELDRKTQSFKLHDASKGTELFYNINDVLEDKEENLWITGDDRNILFYHKKSGKIYDYTDEIKRLIPRRLSLECMMLDRTGVLWVNTVLGMIKIVPKDALFDTYWDEKNELCNGYCSFRGFAEGDNGDVYASYYGGLLKIDNQQQASGIPINDGTPISARGLGWRDGKLILNDGNLFDPTTGLVDSTFQPVRDFAMDVGDIATDGKGTYWITHYNDIYRLDPSENPAAWKMFYKIPDCKFRPCFYYGQTSETLWLGDGNRLFAYQTDSDSWSDHSLFSDQININAIYEDSDSSLWLGLNKGLAHYDVHSGKLRQFTTEEGLSNNFVNGVLPEGDSCLWLSTNQGLSRMNKQSLGFLNFYEQDGLTDNEFNQSSYYKAKDGRLYFGGIQGVNAFYPQEVMSAYRKQKGNGQIKLSAFTRTDEKQQTIITDRLNLNHKQLECYHWNKSITFEFTVSDYKNTSQHKYSYYLEGMEKNWSTPSRYNLARYPSLPPGEYTLRVKALDAKGHWNPNELNVSLKVYPPWWQTGWAKISYVLLFFALMYAGYRLLRYRLDLKNQYRFEQNEARRLKELDTFKSRLFTNLTHEFRTPLTVILGMAEELVEGFKPLDTKTRERLLQHTTLIQRNSQSLLRLVNQLLDLSKLQHKAYTLNWQNDNVIPFLNYIVSSFQAYANQQNILLHFNSSVAKLQMNFDSNLLQQLLTNLISNAIKFTPSGGEIIVSINRIIQNEAAVLAIEVKDTGIGIPASKLEHIFDIFYQVDGSTTRAGEGTGLGLAHSKELVELVNGNISVTSTLKEGTTFLVKLPIDSSTENEVDSPMVSTERLPLEYQSLPQVGMTPSVNDQPKPLNTNLPLLLLIEDNPDVLSYLKSCLSDKYQIAIAMNGRSGIEKALSLIPDLIVSDVMMPEKDGFEVCSFLKEEDKTSHIPIVLLTAKADVASKLAGLKRGADAYLSKPFHKEELLLRVFNLLEKQQQMVNYFKQKYDLTKTKPVAVAVAEEKLIPEDAFLQKINAILEMHYSDQDFGLPRLCQLLGLSRSQLFRKLKALIGESPSNYIKNYRLRKAKTLLETTDLNVSEVAWNTGFASLSHFSRSFQAAFDETPSATCNRL